MDFYELQAPTEWAAPPKIWSSSTIDDVEACPRRWQLLRSRWGVYARFPIRPSLAAIEGQIVHDALDRLTRACGQRGNPEFGSEDFVAAATDVNFFEGFNKAVVEWQQRLATHPRPGPVFRLRTSAEELANQAVRLFRKQYKPEGRVTSSLAHHARDTTVDLKSLLHQKQVLSEVRLEHSALPFVGIIDRAQRSPDGWEIVDFKTGKPSRKHYSQLLRYALLWWRVTDELPTRIVVQYLNGSQSWHVTQEELETAEMDLMNRIPQLAHKLLCRPAPAAPSGICKKCSVRGRCAEGWIFGEKSATEDGHGDAELVVTSKSGEHGFLAQSDGLEVAVVYEAVVDQLLPEIVDGQLIRVLDGVWKDNRRLLEIKAWTEVYVIN